MPCQGLAMIEYGRRKAENKDKEIRCLVSGVWCLVSDLKPEDRSQTTVETEKLSSPSVICFLTPDTRHLKPNCT